MGFELCCGWKHWRSPPFERNDGELLVWCEAKLFANIEDREIKYAGVGCVQTKLERVRETVIGFMLV